ncbi:MAG: LemA family protein [Robiginitomaculum sp.]|nr:LemA family protein [Robiginitomaculum sp.]
MLITLGIIAVIGFYLVIIYNKLVALRQTTGQSWSDIDVQLKQRYDLIPNLVETVKGYAKHEKETLQAVVDARSAAMGAGNVADQAAAENMLTGALKSIFALAEAYPDLKANTNFLQLQAELSDVENKISAARRFYNNSVAEYNTGQEQFPAVLFASKFGFDQREFFEVAASERAAVNTTPNISF